MPKAVLHGAFGIAKENCPSDPLLCGTSVAGYMRNCLDKEKTMDPLLLGFLVFACIDSYRLTLFATHRQIKTKTPTTLLREVQINAERQVKSIEQAFGNTMCTLSQSLESKAEIEALKQYSAKTTDEFYFNAPLTIAGAKVSTDLCNLSHGRTFLNHRHIVSNSIQLYSLLCRLNSIEREAVFDAYPTILAGALHGEDYPFAGVGPNPFDAMVGFPETEEISVDIRQNYTTKIVHRRFRKGS